jgi:lipopolysaccharide/colanic/teichoic acid biosynthesis glycosyltransferase
LEVNLSLERRIGGRQADFLVLATSWLTFGRLFRTVDMPQGLFLAWTLLTTVLLILALDGIGYFERYTPQPELSGVLSLLLTIPASAFAARWLVARVTHNPLIPYSEVLRASIWVAMAFELSQWVIFKIQRTTGQRWVLATCVREDELEALREHLAQSDAGWWIKVKPMNISNSEMPALEGHETLVISRGAVHHLKNHPEFLRAHLRGQRIVDVHQLLKEFRCRLDLHSADAWTFLMNSLHQGFLIRLYFNLKTLAEPILAMILLILTFPLWGLVALAVLITSGRPIFYRQERLGYRGESFLLFKFRTMAIAAEKSGPKWAQKDDPRVTPLGRWLRKTRLDELPQLLNVLRGEISFVGPRPERPEFYQILNQEIPLFSLRLLVRPGITGWAQVMQGYAASVEECRTKLEYDLYYVQNMSPALDLRTIVNTLALMIRGNSGQ